MYGLSKDGCLAKTDILGTNRSWLWPDCLALLDHPDSDCIWCIRFWPGCGLVDNIGPQDPCTPIHVYDA